MLARQIRLLIRVREAPAGTAPADLAKSLGTAPGLVRRLERQAAAFSLKSLTKHLDRLHQADLMLKTSAGNPRLWLEHLVLEMGPG
jgi:DNA polymerase III delta subunit